jgi:hypothetical protein
MENILPIILVFFGESLMIVVEMMAPFFHEKYSTIQFFTLETSLILFGGYFLVFGYIKGLQTYGNIWKISVCSVTTLLIVEPGFALLFYHQLPDFKTTLGFIFGVIGLIITMI